MRDPKHVYEISNSFAEKYRLYAMNNKTLQCIDAVSGAFDVKTKMDNTFLRFIPGFHDNDTTAVMMVNEPLTNRISCANSSFGI